MDANDWWSGLDLRRAVVENPRSFTAHQLIRLLTGLSGGAWEPGAELDPAVETIRFSGSLRSSFPSSDIAAAKIPPEILDGVPKDSDSERRRAGLQANIELASLSFGGPQGPLPTALVEELRQRARAGDRGAIAFLDIFIHRLASVGYRSHRHFRPDLETRPPGASQADRLPRALLGVAGVSARDRAGVPDRVLMRYTALLARRPLSGEAIRRMLADYLRAQVKVRECVGRWLEIAHAERNRLSRQGHNNRLGQDMVLGHRAWRQAGGLAFMIGPVSLRRFEAVLPGGREHERLKSLLRFALNGPIQIDANLIVKGADVPALYISSQSGPRLGWTTWLGRGGGDDRHVGFTLLSSGDFV